MSAIPLQLPTRLLSDLQAAMGPFVPVTHAQRMPWAGAVHEVFPAAGTSFPVATLLAWAAGHAAGLQDGTLLVWIGRRTWPYPRVLDRAGLLERSLFVDAPDASTRLWAAELALRSVGVACVMADGSGFGMTATRRLQLVSRQSRALMLLARPCREEGQLSAAGARWRVGPIPAPREAPLWKVELLRCKGVRPTSLGCHDQPPAWTLCWEAEAGIPRVIVANEGERGDDAGPLRHGRALEASPVPWHPPPLPGGLPADLAYGPDRAAPGASSRRTG